MSKNRVGVFAFGTFVALLDALFLTLIVRYVAEEFEHPLKFSWWKTYWLMILFGMAVECALPFYMRYGKTLKQYFDED